MEELGTEHPIDHERLQRASHNRTRRIRRSVRLQEGRHRQDVRHEVPGQETHQTQGRRNLVAQRTHDALARQHRCKSFLSHSALSSSINLSTWFLFSICWFKEICFLPQFFSICSKRPINAIKCFKLFNSGKNGRTSYPLALLSGIGILLLSMKL